MMQFGVLIPVGDFSIEKKRRSYFGSDSCKHIHMEMDDNGHTVTCEDCNKQLSAYFVLELMLDSLMEQRNQAEREKELVRKERAEICHLRAAKHFESIWRSKDALPVCPHCNEGITAEDALKVTRCSKSLYIQRIKNKVVS